MSISSEEFDLLQYPKTTSSYPSAIPTRITDFNTLEQTVNALQYFVSINWFDDFDDFGLKTQENESQTRIHAIENLILDGEYVSSHIKHPELFQQVFEIFKNPENSLETTPSLLWWKLRAILIYHNLLMQNSYAGETLKSLTLNTINQFFGYVDEDYVSKSMKIQFFLESSQALLMVYEYKNANMFFEEAKKVIGVKFDNVGVLGKKTKFQVEFLAQLVVTGADNEWNWEDAGNVEGDVVMNRDLKTAKDDIGEMNGQILKNETNGKTPLRKEKTINNTCTSKLLPRDVLLDDDTLLDKIQFQDDAEVDQCELSPEQQALCLAIGTQLRKISANHKLSDNQQKAYMEYVLSGVNKKSVYSTRFKALLARSLLETEAWRTVERSLKQIECLIGCTAYSAPELKRQKMVREHDVLENRFKLFYANLIPAVWDQKRALIDLLLKMGCGSTALDLLIGLKMYEDAAKVYKSQKRETLAVELLEKHMEGASEVDKVKYSAFIHDDKID